MADNVTFQSTTAATPPANTVVATETITQGANPAAQAQVIKVGLGGLDAYTGDLSGTNADYDSSAGTQNVTMFGVALPANGGAVPGGTVTNPFNVTGSLTDVQLRATAVPVSGPLTDTQLRATAVPVSGPLTDTQLRATAVPVSGPLTDTQLRATAVPVSGPLTDTQLRATAVPVSGPLTDTQLRAAAVPTLPGQQEVHLGEIGANSAIVTPSLTVSTLAYASGNVVGGVLALTGAMRKSGGTGVLQSMLVIDQSTTPQNLALDVLIFNQNPTNGTYTDRAALTLNTTDAGFVIRRLAVSTSDYKTLGGVAVADVSALGRIVAASGSANLYVLLVANGAATYSGTGVLTARFGLLRD